VIGSHSRSRRTIPTRWHPQHRYARTDSYPLEPVRWTDQGFYGSCPSPLRSVLADYPVYRGGFRCSRPTDSSVLSEYIHARRSFDQYPKEGSHHYTSTSYGVDTRGKLCRSRVPADSSSARTMPPSCIPYCLCVKLLWSPFRSILTILRAPAELLTLSRIDMGHSMP
jgi:hypothetical protein